MPSLFLMSFHVCAALLVGFPLQANETQSAIREISIQIGGIEESVRVEGVPA
jgi:hypothetical protein